MANIFDEVKALAQHKDIMKICYYLYGMTM